MPLQVTERINDSKGVVSTKTAMSAEVQHYWTRTRPGKRPVLPRTLPGSDAIARSDAAHARINKVGQLLGMSVPELKLAQEDLNFLATPDRIKILAALAAQKSNHAHLKNKLDLPARRLSTDLRALSSIGLITRPHLTGYSVDAGRMRNLASYFNCLLTAAALHANGN